MTKMVAMSIPYMVKTLQKSSLPEPKLCMYHRGLLLIIVCSNDDPGVTLTCFTARSNLVTQAYLWENGKTVDI